MLNDDGKSMFGIIQIQHAFDEKYLAGVLIPLFLTTCL